MDGRLRVGALESDQAAEDGDANRVDAEVLRLCDQRLGFGITPGQHFDEHLIEDPLALGGAGGLPGLVRRVGEESGRHAEQQHRAGKGGSGAMAPSPLDQSFDGAGALRGDSEAVDVASQILGESTSGLVAPVGSLVEGLEADRLEVGGCPIRS